jgi:hypothetical protein
VKELRKIAEGYLADDLDFVELKATTMAFKRYLQRLNTLELSNDVYRKDIHLGSGLAIATEWAVRCIDDLERTKTFIKGTAQAIKVMLKRRPGPVHLLYAGTGPYGTLVLPLMSVFTPEEFQLTLIEINDQSYQSVRHIFQQSIFFPFLRDVLQEDAAEVQLKQPETYDILLSETMQNTLKREPQVPITINLLRQLRPDALLVPERIVVHLSAMAFSFQGQIGQIEDTTLGILMESSRSALVDQLNDAGSSVPVFPEVTLNLSPDTLSGNSTLALTTDIHIFGNQHLRFNKSGLTIPDIIVELNDIPPKGLTFKARYHLPPEPGIVWTLEERALKSQGVT